MPSAIKSKDDIEREVRARIDFKLDELKSAMKQAATRNWHIAFNGMNQKASHKWEAFEEMIQMLEKERMMPPPNDEMALRNKRDARDKAVDEIKSVVIKRGEHRGDEQHIIRTIVRAVEKAQNF